MKLYVVIVSVAMFVGSQVEYSNAQINERDCLFDNFFEFFKLLPSMKEKRERFKSDYDNSQLDLKTCYEKINEFLAASVENEKNVFLAEAIINICIDIKNDNRCPREYKQKIPYCEILRTIHGQCFVNSPIPVRSMTEVFEEKCPCKEPEVSQGKRTSEENRQGIRKSARILEQSQSKYLNEYLE